VNKYYQKLALRFRYKVTLNKYLYNEVVRLKTRVSTSTCKLYWINDQTD